MSIEDEDLIGIECPECGHRFEVFAIGDDVACPECSTIFSRFTRVVDGGGQ